MTYYFFSPHSLLIFAVFLCWKLFLELSFLHRSGFKKIFLDFSKFAFNFYTVSVFKVGLLLVQAQCSHLCEQRVSFLALGFSLIQCVDFLGFSPSHLEANYFFCLLFQEVLCYHLFFLFWKFILWCKTKRFADIKSSFSSFTVCLMFCSWGELRHFRCTSVFMAAGASYPSFKQLRDPESLNCCA